MSRAARSFALRASPATVLLVVFGLVPLAVLFAYSFGHSTFTTLTFGTSLSNYSRVLGQSLYVTLLGRSLWIGALAGLVSVVVAFPLVYAITIGRLRRHGDVVLFLVLVSLFSAFIVRAYAWRSLLGRDGVVNSGLEAIGVIDRPLDVLLYSRLAVIITMVNVLVPVAVLPLFAAMSRVDPQVIEASRTLGASPAQTLVRVTLPLAIRGVQAAFALTFIVAAGDYVVPQLVGSGSSQLVGNVIVQTFGVAFDWPLGAALATALIVGILVVIAFFLGLCNILGLRSRPA